MEPLNVRESNMTTLTLAKPSSQAAVPMAMRKRLVSVVTGGHQVAIFAEPIRGVFQIPSVLTTDDRQTVMTPHGELPVVSLAQALQVQLGTEIGDVAQERILVEIQVGERLAAIRVQSISRPLAIDESRFHHLPKVARPRDDYGLIQSLAVLHYELDNLRQALGLVIDPLVALGFPSTARDQQVHCPESNCGQQPPVGPESAAANATADGKRAGKQQHFAGGCGQVLVFIPEQIDPQEVDCAFGLPIAMVAEVTRVPPIVDLPVAAPLCAGYCFWRGKPIPIVRLAQAFFEPAQDEEISKLQRDRRLIVARTASGRFVGFVTRTQMQSMKAPVASSIQPKSLVGRPAYGMFRTEYGLMIIPNFDRILDGDWENESFGAS